MSDKTEQLIKRRAMGLNALWSDSSCQALHPEKLFACVRAVGHAGDHLALHGPKVSPRARLVWPKAAP